MNVSIINERWIYVSFSSKGANVNVYRMFEAV